MSIEAMKQALEALERIDDAMPFPVGKKAITSLRQAISEAEGRNIAEAEAFSLQQEPVAWRFKTGTFWNREPHWRYVLSLEGTEGLQDLEPLYTHSQPNHIPDATKMVEPKREPLTDEQAERILLDMADHVERFCKEDTTEKQMSGECIRYILERVAAHGIKENT